MNGENWIIRDSTGKTLHHSRRSFSGVVSNVHANLLVMSWASAAVIDLKLKNTLFEFSSSDSAGALNNQLEFPSLYYMCYEVLKNTYSLPKSALFLVPEPWNRAASAIADSVTRDNSIQSYIASGGPRWLSDLLSKEGTLCWAVLFTICMLKLFFSDVSMLFVLFLPTVWVFFFWGLLVSTLF